MAVSRACGMRVSNEQRATAVRKATNRGSVGAHAIRNGEASWKMRASNNSVLITPSGAKQQPVDFISCSLEYVTGLIR